jgi:lysophospholipase L1-like esterase
LAGPDVSAARKVAIEIARTLGKAGVALVVFCAITFGWQSYRTRQMEAFAGTLTLPDQTVQDGCAIWFVGSSTVSRWTSLQEDMRPWSTRNRGIGGATLKELNQRFLNEEHPQRPRAIVFYAGENDLAFGVPVEKAVESFGTFMDSKSKKLGTTPVFFMSVKPSPVRWETSADQEAYNAGIRAIAQRRGDLHYIDTRDSFITNGKPGPFYDSDGLHLNSDGYQIFSRAVQQALDKSLPADLIRHCHAVPARS